MFVRLLWSHLRIWGSLHYVAVALRLPPTVESIELVNSYTRLMFDLVSNSQHCLQQWSFALPKTLRTLMATSVMFPLTHLELANQTEKSVPSSVLILGL